MIKIIGPRDKKNVNAINTTSSSPTWSRQLSPFLLGPVKLYAEIESKNMENAWQYSKVYPVHVNTQENLTDEYWEWALKGWMKDHADRYPMGKNQKPLYSIWDNKKLDYIEARKEIYLPLYRDAVKQTPAFNKLKEIYNQNKTVTLFDFDGYDYLSLGKSLKDVLNDSNRKMGHAFVLAMMLTFGENFTISQL